jgi:hypothetical protein
MIQQFSNFLKQAKIDVLKSNINHWLTASKLTTSTVRRKVYNGYVRETKQELNALKSAKPNRLSSALAFSVLYTFFSR